MLFNAMPFAAGLLAGAPATLRAPVEIVGPPLAGGDDAGGSPGSALPYPYPDAADPGAAQEQGTRTTAQAMGWMVRVLLDGEDVSQWLTGSLEIDREEGAAALADLTLHYPPGQQVPLDLTGRPLQIEVTAWAGAALTSSRLFTGWVSDPAWDPLERCLGIQASDGLQQRIEAMDIDRIDALVGGSWSADLFQPLDAGRSHWDYALERLESRTASLDADAHGEPRVTSWYARHDAHFVYGAGATLYRSLSVELQSLRSTVNRIELEVGYRFSHFREQRQSWSWSHPGTQGYTGRQALCAWMKASSELPDIDMITRATEGAGLTLVAASWERLPLSTANPCGNGVAWINQEPDLLLAARWTGAVRWVQPVTERYRLTLAAAAGLDESHRRIERRAFSIEHTAPSGWEDSLKPLQAGNSGGQENRAAEGGSTGGTGNALGAPGERHSEPRRRAALATALLGAHAKLVASHRQTRISWQVPLPSAAGVDLVHTLEVNDQGVRARGKCVRRLDRLELASGRAVTTLSIAVMRGGGTADPLDVPARPGNDTPAGAAPAADGDGLGRPLPTQLGGVYGAVYDDALDGFAGNYSTSQDDSLEPFPRRFTLTAREIPARERDERRTEAEHLYRVAVPDDLLEL